MLMSYYDVGFLHLSLIWVSAKTSFVDNVRLSTFFCTTRNKNNMEKTKEELAVVGINEELGIAEAYERPVLVNNEFSMKGLSDWQRLQLIIAMSHLTISGFGRYIGVERSEVLYRIKRGQNRISHTVADLVVAHFPFICKGWLLTGDGSALSDEFSPLFRVPQRWQRRVLPRVDDPVE